MAKVLHRNEELINSIVSSHDVSIPYVTLVTQKSGEPSDSLWVIEIWKNFKDVKLSSNKICSKWQMWNQTWKNSRRQINLQQKDVNGVFQQNLQKMGTCGTKPKKSVWRHFMYTTGGTTLQHWKTQEFHIPISRYTGLFNLVSYFVMDLYNVYIYMETPIVDSMWELHSEVRNQGLFIQKHNPQKKQREKSTNQYKIKQTFRKS